VRYRTCSEHLGGFQISLDQVLSNRRNSVVFEAANGFVWRESVGGPAGIAEQIADCVVVLLVGQSSQRRWSYGDGDCWCMRNGMRSGRPVCRMDSGICSGCCGATGEEKESGNERASA